MDKEDADYYEHQLAMFESRGWKYFTAQVEQIREATNSIVGVKPEDVRFKQGELSILNWILGWPQAVKVAYDAKEDPPTTEE